MNRLFFVLALAIAPSPALAAPIFVQDLGTAAPPATLGGYTMTPFGPDPRPVFTDVTTVPSPLGGNLTFGAGVNPREIGNGWATWSHGYTGDVYYTNGATSLLTTLPADTGAFYFYVEPNPFNTFTFTATANDGTSLALTADGNAGARGFGFFADPGFSITTVTVSSSVDFAVGEFGIAAAVPAAPVPEPATLTMFGALAVGAFALRRRLKQAAA